MIVNVVSWLTITNGFRQLVVPSGQLNPVVGVQLIVMSPIAVVTASS